MFFIEGEERVFIKMLEGGRENGGHTHRWGGGEVPAPAPLHAICLPPCSSSEAGIAFSFFSFFFYRGSAQMLSLLPSSLSRQRRGSPSRAKCLPGGGVPLPPPPTCPKVPALTQDHAKAESAGCSPRGMQKSLPLSSLSCHAMAEVWCLPCRRLPAQAAIVPALPFSL